MRPVSASNPRSSTSSAASASALPSVEQRERVAVVVSRRRTVTASAAQAVELAHRGLVGRAADHGDLAAGDRSFSVADRAAARHGEPRPGNEDDRRERDLAGAAARCSSSSRIRDRRRPSGRARSGPARSRARIRCRATARRDPPRSSRRSRLAKIERIADGFRVRRRDTRTGSRSRGSPSGRCASR